MPNLVPRVSFLFIFKIGWKFTGEEEDPGSYFRDLDCDSLFKTAGRIKIIGELMVFQVRRVAFRNKQNGGRLRRKNLVGLACKKMEHITKIYLVIWLDHQDIY